MSLPNHPSALTQGSSADPELAHPHSPRPNPATGELLLDPEILLKARSFDLQVEFFYKNATDVNGPYGKNRSASVAGHVVSSTDPTNPVVDLVRGDFTMAAYSKSGSTYTPYAQAYSPNSLTYSGGTFKETYPDGMFIEYGEVLPGFSPPHLGISRVGSPSGDFHTYSYGTGAEAGLLKTIAVPGGKVLTFSYAASSPTSLLSYVEDWGGRRWTFTYDGSRNLTAFAVPLGCTTQYGFATGPSGKTVLAYVEDPRGYRTDYGYDAEDRVVTIVQGSAITTYAYNVMPGFSGSVMTNPAGGKTTFTIDNALRIVGESRPDGVFVRTATTPTEEG
ncbi:MAG: hypothetical protein ACO1SV_25040 [Fimbriimonas sp.]